MHKIVFSLNPPPWLEDSSHKESLRETDKERPERPEGGGEQGCGGLEDAASLDGDLLELIVAEGENWLK